MWAVTHERTVVAMSYRYPDAPMRGVTLDDYLQQGPRQALDVIGDIAGAPKDYAEPGVLGAFTDERTVPWYASYRATKLLGGDVRYVPGQRRS